MISLNQSAIGTPLFVLEIHTTKEEKKYLEGIGIFTEALVSIIKNNGNKEDPVLVEVQETRFMIGFDLAQKIFVSPALDKQELIFQGNKTRQRELILEVLKKFKNHFSLQECVMAVQKKDKTIGEITVYRTLKTLLEKNILEEFELPDGTKKMELLKGHHDHIFCQNCGNIIEFYNKEIEALQEKVAKEKGVSLISHRMILMATDCPKCR